MRENCDYDGDELADYDLIGLFYAVWRYDKKNGPFTIGEVVGQINSYKYLVLKPETENGKLSIVIAIFSRIIEVGDMSFYTTKEERDITTFEDMFTEEL